MANSGQVLQRNNDFAATCAHQEASIIARHPAARSVARRDAG